MRAAVVALLALLALAPAAALGAQPRASFNDVEDEVMCDTCNVPLEHRRVRPRRPGARRDPQAHRAGADQAADPGRARAHLRARHPRQAAGQRLQPRGLVGAGRRRGRAGRAAGGAAAALAPARARPAATIEARARAPALSAADERGAWTRTSRGTTSDARRSRRTADTTVIAAFAVGFVSFISPCVLPLVPGYLSAVSGVSLTDIREGRHSALARARPGDRLLPVLHAHVRRAGHDRHGPGLDAARLQGDARQGRRASSSSRWASSSCSRRSCRG